MIAEKPITLRDIKMMCSCSAGRGKAVKIMTKNTPLDKHYRLLNRIIRSL